MRDQPRAGERCEGLAKGAEVRRSGRRKTTATTSDESRRDRESLARADPYRQGLLVMLGSAASSVVIDTRDRVSACRLNGNNSCLVGNRRRGDAGQDRAGHAQRDDDWNSESFADAHHSSMALSVHQQCT